MLRFVTSLFKACNIFEMFAFIKHMEITYAPNLVLCVESW